MDNHNFWLLAEEFSVTCTYVYDKRSFSVVVWLSSLRFVLLFAEWEKEYLGHTKCNLARKCGARYRALIKHF